MRRLWISLKSIGETEFHSQVRKWGAWEGGDKREKPGMKPKAVHDHGHEHDNDYVPENAHLP
jgi:hypothetical protein